MQLLENESLLKTGKQFYLNPAYLFLVLIPLSALTQLLDTQSVLLRALHVLVIS